MNQFGKITYYLNRIEIIITACIQHSYKSSYVIKIISNAKKGCTNQEPTNLLRSRSLTKRTGQSLTKKLMSCLPEGANLNRGEDY